MQSEFFCEIYENDYRKSMLKFDELLNQFNKKILEFNSLVLIRNIKNLNNGRVIINDIKTTKILDISMDGIAEKPQYYIRIAKLKEELSTSDQEIEHAKQELRNRGEFNTVFRGKNQLDFFVKFLELLRDVHNTGNFFEKKRSSVTINITNNRLSELSQYADVPNCLISFLKNHAI